MYLDPDVFDPAAVDEETARVNAEVEARLAEVPAVHQVPVAESRAAREEGRGPFGPLVRSDRAEERTIDGPAGALTLRVLPPASGSPNGAYLHLHGGGWTLGRAHHQDLRLEAMADAASVVVVSVDYRLAPEDPFPAAMEDAEAAGRWLRDHASEEYGVDRLVIGGDSAGAHLSVMTLLRLRDRDGATGYDGADLVYGAFDLSGTPSVRNWGERNLVLSTPIVGWFTDNAVPEDRRRDPDVSPLYADLHDLPPALFTVGSLDPLIDDSLFMAARWTAAGNDADLRVYPGGIHGFLSLPVDYGLQRELRATCNRFVAEVVGASTGARDE